MRIQSNISAINTQRQMFRVNNQQSKALEKLSSGFRINRAADDAAGLAISEKMRSQIRGMRQASRNAQDGISVVQTAEGALDEVHSMLQRMKELAVQSANDSNQSIVDREAIQLEVDALTEEINSITQKTQFNKMNLLDGSFVDKHFHVGANADQTIGINIDSMTAVGLGLNVGGTQSIESSAKPTVVRSANGVETAAPGETIAAADDAIDLTSLKSAGATKDAPLKLFVNVNGTEKAVEITDDDADGAKAAKAVIDVINEVVGPGTAEAGTTAGKIKLNKAIQGVGSHGASVTVTVDQPVPSNIKEGGAATAFKTKAAGITKPNGAITQAEAELTFDYQPTTTDRNIKVNLNGKEYDVFIKANTSLTDAVTKIGDVLKDGTTELATVAAATTEGITIKSVAKGQGARIQVEVPGMVEMKNVSFKGVNVLTRQAANASMTNVQDAIENLASRRAKLGAIQNRIEHTISNLDNSHENLKAAEARVRDTDMAEMIIESARTSILSQAAISMLSQANQVPQNVLSLLR